jgi:pyruvate/2-oxoglutarate dehydrogenase complex dihydrolipoamide dehydrogenase (E3) component
MTEPYDLAVIGAGSAGLTAAGVAVQLGLRVALVEKRRVGGDCTWTGCVPSKTLRKSAKVAHQMRTASQYGLPNVEPQVDFQAVMAHVRAVVRDIYQEESPQALRDEGIDVFLGAARFLDPMTIAVGDDSLEARHVLIATGAHPHIPPIEGLDGLPYLTYESIWDLEALPQHLVVVGAGPVGCEMAQAYGRLGAQVTLLASGERVLPRDEPSASRVIEKVFAAEGIDVRCGARAAAAWRDSDGVHLTAGGDEFSGDALLIAAGRRPNVIGLDLEKAGVAYNASGIEVDRDLRTSQRHIYAAGDCLGGPQFTHYAGWQAFMAVRNAFLPGAAKGLIEHVPWTTFTDPEVAHVGMTLAQARALHGNEAMTCGWSMRKVDRARAEGDTQGFLKVVHKRDGALLGVTAVCDRAGEMLQEWIVAWEHGLKVGDVGSAMHVYPTYSTASQQAAAAVRVNQLLAGTPGRLVKRLARLL